MHLAESTAYTAIFIKDLRFCVFAGPDDFLRTKGHTDTTAFTPIIIKRDIKLFLFFCVVLHRVQSIILFKREAKSSYISYILCNTCRGLSPVKLYSFMSSTQRKKIISSSSSNHTPLKASWNFSLQSAFSFILSIIA